MSVDITPAGFAVLLDGLLAALAGGQLVFLDADGSQQAACALPSPAGERTDGLITLAAPLEAQRTAGATIATASLRSALAAELLRLDVTSTGAGGAVQLDHTAGHVGAWVRITSAALGF